MNLHTIREITYGTIFFRLFLSIVIGGVLGLERGRKSRPAGLRTYILVCLGSTVVMMTNQYVSQCMNTGDPVRMGAQVLSGIGFIGAGSIMKTGRNQVRGITTAAGLWAAACIGLAIGIGFYEVAIAGGILIFIVLSLMQNMDYYNCSKVILNQLGQMYGAGGAFTENINAAGGVGAAEFAQKAIEIYCK